MLGSAGSGKSVTGFSVMRLVDAPGRIVEGKIRFLGQDLAAPGQATRSFGLYDIRDGKMVNIAFPVWHWGKFYGYGSERHR